jgi:hypothetical protein
MPLRPEGPTSLSPARKDWVLVPRRRLRSVRPTPIRQKNSRISLTWILHEPRRTAHPGNAEFHSALPENAASTCSRTSYPRVPFVPSISVPLISDHGIKQFPHAFRLKALSIHPTHAIFGIESSTHVKRPVERKPISRLRLERRFLPAEKTLLASSRLGDFALIFSLLTPNKSSPHRSCGRASSLRSVLLDIYSLKPNPRVYSSRLNQTPVIGRGHTPWAFTATSFFPVF